MSRQGSQSDGRPTSSASHTTQNNAVPSGPMSQKPSPSKPSTPSGSAAKPKKSMAIPIKNAQGEILDLKAVKASSVTTPTTQSARTPPTTESAATPPPKISVPGGAQNDSTADVTKSRQEIQNELREKIRLAAQSSTPDKPESPSPIKTSAEPESGTEPAATVAPPKADAKDDTLPAAEKVKITSQDVKEPTSQASKEAPHEDATLSQAKAPEAPKPAASVKEEPKAAESAKPAEPAKEVSEEDEMEAMIRQMEEEDARREKEQEEITKKKMAEKEAAKKPTLTAAENDLKLREQEREMERLEEEKERKAKEGGAKSISVSDALSKAHAGVASDEDLKGKKEGKKPTTASDVASKLSELKISESKPSSETQGSGRGAQEKPRAAKPPALTLKSTNIEPAQPSAALQSLKSARFLTVMAQNIYPPGIHSPNPAVNQAVAQKQKSFKYDASFLQQFQKVFVDQPSVEFSQQVKSLIGDSEGGRSGTVKTPSVVPGGQAQVAERLASGPWAPLVPQGALGAAAKVVAWEVRCQAVPRWAMP